MRLFCLFSSQNRVNRTRPKLLVPISDMHRYCSCHIKATHNDLLMLDSTRFLLVYKLSNRTARVVYRIFSFRYRWTVRDLFVPQASPFGFEKRNTVGYFRSLWKKHPNVSKLKFSVEQGCKVLLHTFCSVFLTVKKY